MEVEEDTFVEEVGEEQLEAVVRRRSSSRFSLDTASSLPTLAALKKSDVRTLVWGRGDFGQLGNGSTENVNIPQINEAHFNDRDVSYADGNLFNSAIVTGDGEVFTMGNNTTSQLGQKVSCDMILVPYRVGALENYRIAQIACGEQYMVAVTEVGQLASWGRNDCGQLGHSRKNDEASTVSKPSIIRSVDELNFVRVAAGQSHTLALTGGGQVVSFGSGAYGALGHGKMHSVTQPLMIDGLWEIGVVQISCGENHSAALSADGKLFMWGHGKYGQLGFECQNCNEPQEVAFPPNLEITQISCGGNHTLALTKDVNGDTAVYSWGQGSWGQTGLAHNNNTHIPTIIPQFNNLHIAQISAGFRHSLVLTRDNKLFAFGNNEQGQLGINQNENQVVNYPMLVSGFEGVLILFVQAMGDHNMAVVQKIYNSKTSRDLISGPMLQGRSQGARTLPYQLPSLLEVIISANETKEFAHLNRVVEDVFQSPGLLLAGFTDIKNTELNQDNMDIDDFSSNQNNYFSHNLDLNAISLIYRKLVNPDNPKIIAHLGQACLRVLYQVQALLDDQKFDIYFSMRLLLVLIQNPFNSQQQILEDERLGPQLLLLYLGVIRQFQQQQNNYQIFQRWLHDFSPEVFGRDLVKATLDNILSICQSQAWPDARRQIKPILDLLNIFYDVSTLDGKDLIPFNKFQCKEISQFGNMQQEYDFFVRKHLYNQQQNNGGNWSILDYAFVLTPEVKSQYVKYEAFTEQQTQFRESTFQALFRGEGLYRMHSIGFFSLSIRRSDLMRDALTKILNSDPSDFKKKLRVKFVSNDVEEPGQDEGGLTKEFFQLLTKDLFDVSYGMFSYDEETRTYWFRNINHLDDEQKLEFKLVGILFGLAIYNGVLLDVHFPLVVYKKLLGQQPTFQDLKKAFPQLGNGLQQLLDFEGDVENTFVRDFTMQYDCFEEVITKELKPDGANIPVTNQNRQEYVQAYTDFVLTDSIEPQFEAFSAGFQKVCSIGKNSVLSLLRPEELEQLVCGLPHYEFKALEKNTKYEGGYSAVHPSIKMFWEIIGELSLSQKKKFLSFTTGSDRAPIGGLGTMNFIIQRGGPDTEKLPTSHTCFNIILLPQYKSKEKMKQKLLTAIENAQGFGLR